MRGGEAAAEHGLPVGKRRMVTFAVMFAAFISVLDSTIVNVALRNMRGAFGVDLSMITWVASSYTIAQVIMIVMSAWWSTLLGRKRFLLISHRCFHPRLRVGRHGDHLQRNDHLPNSPGSGGGSLVPISQAILRESYPPRLHGAAMARFGMGVVLAPALGPVVGGYLTEEFGWPWIFYINVPFAIVGFLLVNAYVKDPPYLKRGIQKVDWAGIAFLTIAITGVQIVLERGQEENWFDSNWIIAVTAITAISLVALVLWELRTNEPIVDLRVLRNIPLAVGSGIMLIFGIAQFGTTFILPQFLQDLLQYTPYHAGMIMAPRGVMLFLTLIVVGRLFRYVDSRYFIPVGAALIIFGMAVFSGLSLDAGFWNMLPGLILLGMGAPFIFITLFTISLGSVPPEDTTAAAGIFNLARRMGGNIGFALLTTILERRVAFHRINLIPNITETNEAFLRFKARITESLLQQQIPSSLTSPKSLALADRMVERQSIMLAYNDLYMFLGVMFLAIVPLVLFFKFPKREA